MRLGKAIIPIMLIVIAVVLIIYGLTPQQKPTHEIVNVTYTVRFYDKADHIIMTPLNVTLYKDTQVISKLNSNSTGWYSIEKAIPPNNYTLIVRIGNLTLYQKNINLNSNITESKVVINAYPLYVNLYPKIDNNTMYNITNVNAIIYALNGTQILKQSISESKQTNVINFPLVPEGNYILKVNWLGINIYTRNIIINNSTNINVNITGHLISFKVYDQYGTPLNNATLELYYNNSRVLIGRTLSTNNYTITAVLPKLEYNIRVYLYDLKAKIKGSSYVDLRIFTGKIYNITAIMTKNVELKILNPDGSIANGLILSMRSDNSSIISPTPISNMTKLPSLPSNSNVTLLVYRADALALKTTLTIPPPSNNTIILTYKINEVPLTITLRDINNNDISNFSGSIYLIDKFNNSKIMYKGPMNILPSSYLIIVLNKMPDGSIIPIYADNRIINVTTNQLTLVLPVNIKLDVSLHEFTGNIELKYIGISNNIIPYKSINNTNGFSFTLPTGKYLVEVYSNGKLVYSRYIMLNKNENLIVQLSSPGIISSIDIELIRSIVLLAILVMIGFISVKFYKQYMKVSKKKEEKVSI
ncbi:MAG: hypothetical protein ACP5GU_08550 [Thermoprotei archaeon]|jgi:hypothetical protein